MTSAPRDRASSRAVCSVHSVWARAPRQGPGQGMPTFPRAAGVTEHMVDVGAPAPTFYLAAGPEDGPVVIFVHGWPELSISWRHQLPVLGGAGFRAVAPDMRGYGRSYIPAEASEVAHEHTVRDLIGLLDALAGAGSKAVFVGHDWGAPIVWQLATHHPDRCHGVANLCVGYRGPTEEGQGTLIDRVALVPDALQWDYQLLHQRPDDSKQGLDEDIHRSVKAIFRAMTNEDQQAVPPRMFNHYATMFDQRARFAAGENPWIPDRGATIELDDRMLTAQDAAEYTHFLEANGGFGVPGFYYQNHARDAVYSGTDVTDGGRLSMPVLMLAARNDRVCYGTEAELERWASRLSTATVDCGHWMAQERPTEVNSLLLSWLATEVPAAWPTVAMKAQL